MLIFRVLTSIIFLLTCDLILLIQVFVSTLCGDEIMQTLEPTQIVAVLRAHVRSGFSRLISPQRHVYFSSFNYL
jgi:hypothetical protein